MEITTELIKQLRDETGVSVMQCKKALEEAEGDMEKAKVILRKESKAIAEKKANRDLNAGIITSYIHNTGKVGVMLEMLCETDFVAKNEDFQTLANDIAMHITAMTPEYTKLSDITEEDKLSAREIFTKEVAELDKPEEVKAKILEGKMNDYFGAKTLLDQAFIKNPDTTIGKMIEEATQKIGERIEVGRWQRFEI